VNATAVHTVKDRRGHTTPASPPPVTGPEAVERRLALLLCGTQSRRRDRAGEVAALAARADAGRLGELLGRLRLAPLAGARLRELGVEVSGGLREQIEQATAWGRERGTGHELITLSLLASLEQAGIRALALKGSMLARQLYGDVALRSAGDIDILVTADDLPHAVEVMEGLDWSLAAPTARPSPLPLLHETLTHPTMPRVELHWRVHWYEDRFSSDALARADRAAPHQPLVMAPSDGLAALTLFYARDGFAGLRMPADAATWWEIRCDGADADAIFEAQVDRYPELSGPLRVGSYLLVTVTGIPARREVGRLRWRVAAQLATPFDEVTAVQVKANASLVDTLLAPRGGAGDAVRREARKVPPGHQRRLTRRDALPVHLARWEHLLRMARRWLIGLGPAASRAYRRQPLPSSGETVA
jgi:hypothetical protein